MKQQIEFVKWHFGKDATWAENPARERIAELLDAGWSIAHVNAVAPQAKYDQPGYHITMMVRSEVAPNQDMDYDYTATWQVKPRFARDGKEYEPFSVDTLRKKGWKVCDAYGENDGTLYHVLRRPHKDE